MHKIDFIIGHQSVTSIIRHVVWKESYPTVIDALCLSSSDHLNPPVSHNNNFLQHPTTLVDFTRAALVMDTNTNVIDGNGNARGMGHHQNIDLSFIFRNCSGGDDTMAMAVESLFLSCS